MHNHSISPRRLGRQTRLATCLGLALALAGGSALAATPSTGDGGIDGTRNTPLMLRNGITSGQLELAAQLLARDDGEASHASGIDATHATIPVYNCNDSGNGSLRAAVASANSGDIVDLTGLSCSTIALESSIVTSADNLTIKGSMDDPGAKYPAISGQNNVTPLLHYGSGTLTLSGVAVTSGRFEVSATSSMTAYGGCIASQGNVVLTDFAQAKYCSTVHQGSGDAMGGAIYSAGTTTIKNGAAVLNSTARSNSGRAAGGGIYAKGAVTLNGAAVSRNKAITTTGAIARGGGLYTARDMTAKYSIISDNKVSGDNSFATVAGGGASVNGNTLIWIRNSSIYDNEAPAAAGLLLGKSGNGTTLIEQSTISGNTATASNSKYGGGGVWLGNKTDINGSTIAGNTETNADGTSRGGGISIDSGVQLAMKSTLVARNRRIIDESTQVFSNIVARDSTAITGNNLLLEYGSTHNIALPPDTILSGNFAIGPLADNGGLTPTMALPKFSPAIDTGVTNSKTWDQRGEGFKRRFGAAADIGAFEYGGDTIFADGFDG